MGSNVKPIVFDLLYRMVWLVLALGVLTFIYYG